MEETSDYMPETEDMQETEEVVSSESDDFTEEDPLFGDYSNANCKEMAVDNLLDIS